VRFIYFHPLLPCVLNAMCLWSRGKYSLCVSL
jgi:hypothetical protein